MNWFHRSTKNVSVFIVAAENDQEIVKSYETTLSKRGIDVISEWSESVLSKIENKEDFIKIMLHEADFVAILWTPALSQVGIMSPGFRYAFESNKITFIVNFEFRQLPEIPDHWDVIEPNLLKYRYPDKCGDFSGSLAELIIGLSGHITK